MSVRPIPREARESAAELGRRFAVACALVVALVSLLRHAPVWLASLHGAATLVVALVLNRLGTAALARAIESDLARARARGDGQ